MRQHIAERAAVSGQAKAQFLAGYSKLTVVHRKYGGRPLVSTMRVGRNGFTVNVCFHSPLDAGLPDTAQPGERKHNVRRLVAIV